MRSKPLLNNKNILIAVSASIMVSIAFIWSASRPLRAKPFPLPQTISIIRVNYEWPDAGAVKYQKVHQIVNPQQIAQVVLFVNQYKSGWASVLPSGLANPSGSVNLEFYQGVKEVGYWGIGPDNFKADGEKSDVLYRHVKREEVDHILSILKLNQAVVPRT